MRNVMKVLAAGTLVVCLSGGLVYAEDAAAPTLTVIGDQKTILPGRTGTFEVRIQDVQNLGALQVKIEISGGQQGTLTVKSMTIAKTDPNYVFASAETFSAVDSSGPQMRAGAVVVGDGVDVGESKIFATFIVEASRDAVGTYTVTLVENEAQTFLRDANAVAIQVLIKSSQVTVGSVAVPTKDRKRTTNRG